MMLTKLDLTKPVQTRSGRPARILCTDLDRPDGRKLVVAYAVDANFEVIGTRLEDGRIGPNGESRDDIVNVPEKYTAWAVWYSYADRPETVHVVLSPKEPDRVQWAKSAAVLRAVKKVEVAEGEGV